MKDLIGERLAACTEDTEVKALIDDYIDYYNNDRYQWDLAKLSPNEYYEFATTGVCPIKISNPPPVPVIRKDASELGKDVNKSDQQGAGDLSRDSTLGAERPGSP